jgi:hypothetical protein
VRTTPTTRDSWRFLNPFWRVERVMRSSLRPDECRLKLKKAPTSITGIARLWFGGGDAAFYRGGAGAMKAGSLLETHVRVDVAQAAAGGSELRLRYSWGIASSLLLVGIIAAGVVMFGLTIAALSSSRSWQPIYGAGLLAILVPGLLMGALRAEAPGAMDELWEFVAKQVGGRA